MSLKIILANHIILVYRFFKNMLITETAVTLVIIYMKKLLDSDWLRTVQFKCNTSAKSVTPVQITHHNVPVNSKTAHPPPPGNPRAFDSR